MEYILTTTGSTEVVYIYMDYKEENHDVILHNFGIVDGKLTKIY